jgi:methyl-accepting chemotaxis protein/methyl-accepting chemotaxis protein-2 (aspartate sensor receptor)
MDTQNLLDEASNQKRKKRVGFKAKFLIMTFIQIAMITIIGYAIKEINLASKLQNLDRSYSINLIYLKLKFDKFYDDYTFGDEEDLKKSVTLLTKRSQKYIPKDAGIYESIDRLINDVAKVNNSDILDKRLFSMLGFEVFSISEKLDKKVKELKKLFDNQQAKSIILADFKNSGDKVFKELDKLILELHDEVYRANDFIEDLSIVLIIFAVLVGFIIAFVSIKVLDNLTKRFQKYIDRITKSNQEIYDVSHHLDLSSTALEDRLQQQSKNNEYINSLAFEAGKANQENQINIAKAMENVNQNYNSSLDGTTKVKALYESMNEITKLSKQISDIIKTMDDISFQINLLALNASVEAARAGEHGLGFAIVAEEVKRLADKSKEASMQVSDTIELSLDKINKNHLYTKETEELMSDVLQKSIDSKDIVEKVVNAINSQSGRIAKIEDTIHHMYAITEENFATAKDTSSQAAELRGELELMNRSIKKLSRF